MKKKKKTWQDEQSWKETEWSRPPRPRWSPLNPWTFLALKNLQQHPNLSDFYPYLICEGKWAETFGRTFQLSVQLNPPVPEEVQSKVFDSLLHERRVVDYVLLHNSLIQNKE